MDNANISLPIKELERRFRSVTLRLPVIAGNEVVNFALDNFKRQAWLGDTVEPWKPRKNPTKWGQTPKRNGRAILVDSGRLRRSPRIIRTTPDMVVVGTDVPYARAHNEGVRLGVIQTVKPFQRKMKTGKTVNVKEHIRHTNQNIPRRQFLGNSQYLTNRLRRTAMAEYMKAFR